MRTIRRGVVGAIAVVLLLSAVACGDSGDDASSSNDEDKPSLTIASFDFGESEILANIYGKALEDAGYEVSYKLKLGSREVVAPALAGGDVDLVPEYVGNYLSFLDPDGLKPGDDIAAATAALTPLAEEEGVAVLEPSPAADGDATVVTRKTATDLKLEKISDLKSRASSLVYGGPPECPQRATCLLGYESEYGIKFKEFKPLDVGGPLTKAALEKGDIQVARLFSSDPAIKAKDFFVLDDDLNMQPPGNVVPVIRADKLTDEVREILDGVSAKLTTDALIEMNTKVDVDLEDAADVAQTWLEDSGLLKS